MTIRFVVSLAIILGLLLFLVQQLRRSPGPREWGRTPVWPKRIRVTLAIVLLLVAGIIFWAFLIEPNRLIVREQKIAIANWPKELSGLRIAVIADIHAGGPFIDDQKLRLIVARTNQLQPDLIVLLGDYMSGGREHNDRVEPEAFAPAFKEFRAPLGVYSVLGNHDWWYDGPKVRRALEKNGIRVLDDEVTEIKWRDRSFWLAGLADLWTRPQHVKETIARVPRDQAVIALTHNPDIFPELPRTVPLLLAGHTHGGQVQFPLIGNPVQVSKFGERYLEGHVFENEHHLFVTTGIGTSIIGARFRVPPEIVLLTISTPS